MKKLKKINQLYKKASLKNREAKKAYLKAKGKGVKKKGLLKLWKKWQKAKYYKKALKTLLAWEKADNQKKVKNKKAKKKKARAKSDQGKKSKNKKDKPVATSRMTSKQSDKVGPASVKKKSKSKPRGKGTLHRVVPKNPISIFRNTTNKPTPSIHPEDLKKIEGIGPKIEQILYAAGIKTWKALAGTPVEKLRNILAAAGPRLRMHNPGSWPRQASLAERGKWAELKKLQEHSKKNK